MVENTTNKQQTIKLLSALYSDMSYIPKGVNIQLLSDKYDDYMDLANHIRMDAIIIKFLHSSNNRQLFFWKIFPDASQIQLEPALDINKMPRFLQPGKDFYFGNSIINENDIFVGEPLQKWDPKKWNIADTHEPAYWTFSHFINLYIKKQQTFELEFEILAQRNSSILF